MADDPVDAVLDAYFEYLEVGGDEPTLDHLSPEDRAEAEQLIASLNAGRGIDPEASRPSLAALLSNEPPKVSSNEPPKVSPMAELFAPAGVVSRCQTCGGSGDPNRGQPTGMDLHGNLIYSHDPCDCDGGWVTSSVTQRPSCPCGRHAGPHWHYVDENDIGCVSFEPLHSEVPSWARVVCPGDTVQELNHYEVLTVFAVWEDGTVVLAIDDEATLHVWPSDVRLVVPDIGNNPFRVAAGLVP